MATIQVGEAALHVEEHGDPHGFPVLLLAPGGMDSAAQRWAAAPLDPLRALPGHRLIAMDQRNAGRSRAPITGAEGWATYTADQRAVADALGLTRYAVLGMCIGGPFAIRLALADPARVAGAVLLQPIGLADNRATFYALFDAWQAANAPRHPDVDPAAWASYRHAMWGGDDPLFGASDADLAACEAPLLVLRGDDVYHPASASERVVAHAPRARLVPRWREPDASPGAVAAVRAFLAALADGRAPWADG